MRDVKSYRDTRRGLGRFRVQDNKLLVRGLYKQEDSDAAVNTFARNQLLNYGFHSTRAEAALEASEGNFGSAIEHLMTSCFGLMTSSEAGDEPNGKTAENHAEEQIADEKMALESIYGDSFSEKIAGKIWEFVLEIPALEKFIQVFMTILFFTLMGCSLLTSTTGEEARKYWPNYDNL